MRQPTEQALEAELLRRYQEGAKLGYRASRFYQLFTRHCKKYMGGIAAVQHVLGHGKTAGFKFILKEGRDDLSLEALVLDPKWAHLFSNEDRQIASQRLSESKQPTS